jgi:hypothetical protein
MMESFKEAVARFVGLVIKPDEEWNVIASEKPGLAEVLFPYSSIGLVLFIAATVLGYLLRSFRSSFILELLISLAVYLLPLAIFCGCTLLLAGSMKAVRKELSIQVCLYAFSPAWVISLLHVIPVISFGWLWIIISLIFASYLFSKAAGGVLGVPEGKKTVFTILALSSMVGPAGLLFLLKYLWLLSREIF